MNRRGEMEELLLKIKNDYYLDMEYDGSIYGNLAYFDLTYEDYLKNEYKYSNSDFHEKIFKKLLSYYEKNSEISAKHLKDYKHFLLFSLKNDKSKKDTNENHLDCYKLYINLEDDYIIQGVKKLFDFIGKNQISNDSKLADSLRSDSIVIRLKNKDDVYKILDYVNNDSFFKKHCKKTNPFLFRNGVVGMSYDRLSSYNCTLSYVLDKYFTSRKSCFELDKVSVDDLKSYLISFRDNVKNNEDDALKLINDPSFSSIYTDRVRNLLPKNYVEASVINFLDVLDLIIYFLDDLKNVDDYFEKVDSYTDVYSRRMRETIFEKKYGEKYKDVKGDYEFYCDDLLLNTVNYVNLFITSKFSKTHDIDSICSDVNNYISNCDFQLDNSILYGKLGTYSDKNIFKKYLNEKTNGDVFQYVYNIIQLNNTEVKNFFYDACLDVYSKGDIFTLVQALIDGKNGCFDLFDTSYKKKIDSLDSSVFDLFADDMIEKICTWCENKDDFKKINSILNKNNYKGFSYIKK